MQIHIVKRNRFPIDFKKRRVTADLSEAVFFIQVDRPVVITAHLQVNHSKIVFLGKCNHFFQKGSADTLIPYTKAIKSF